MQRLRTGRVSRSADAGSRRGGRRLDDLEVIWAVRTGTAETTLEAQRQARPVAVHWGVLRWGAHWLKDAGLKLPEFEIPDEVTAADGTTRRLSDDRQGSIEFWIRRLIDDRVASVPRTTVLDNGSLSVALPANVPLDEWCHVAVDWFPLPDNAPANEPGRSLVCVYVDGVDYGNYRSMYWAGYSVRPQLFPTKKPWTIESSHIAVST